MLYIGLGTLLRTPELSHIFCIVCNFIEASYGFYFGFYLYPLIIMMKEIYRLLWYSDNSIIRSQRRLRDPTELTPLCSDSFGRMT